MAIHLTAEQEQRIKAVVDAGAYRSTEEALDAAVAAVESVAAPGFEGTQEELEALLAEGLNSGNPVEVDETFWRRLTEKAGRIALEHQARNPRR
jgi:Arc/MetJ-type ribon-helix-helix transcriptional regulator